MHPLAIIFTAMGLPQVKLPLFEGLGHIKVEVLHRNVCPMRPFLFLDYEVCAVHTDTHTHLSAHQCTVAVQLRANAA